jgi:hypothetical protein
VAVLLSGDQMRAVIALIVIVSATAELSRDDCNQWPFEIQWMCEG